MTRYRINNPDRTLSDTSYHTQIDAAYALVPLAAKEYAESDDYATDHPIWRDTGTKPLVAVSFVRVCPRTWDDPTPTPHLIYTDRHGYETKRVNLIADQGV